MKNKIIKFLSKPKTIIPIFAVIGIAVIAFSYNYIGKSPKIDFANDNNSAVATTGNSIDLSFLKSGRVDSVSAIVGQIVHKGDVLAKLNAPDAEGALNQAKGALDLAEAQYASLNSQYATTKKQQDLIVSNAYQTLLSSGLEAVPSKQNTNVPVISGSYTCAKEGIYKIHPYASGDSDSGYSFTYSGLESGTTSVKYDNPVAFGNCGLQIKWNQSDYFDATTDWTIDIPNTKSASYTASNNAYELAKANREKVLADLSTTIGNDNADTSVAKAQVNAAKGAYEAVLGAYQNNLIIAPVDGTISFVDSNLKVGQTLNAGKPVISINTK